MKLIKLISVTITATILITSTFVIVFDGDEPVETQMLLSSTSYSIATTSINEFTPDGNLTLVDDIIIKVNQQTVYYCTI